MLSIVVVIFALWLVPKVVLFFEVDHCLDNGGSYNYDRCECDYKKNHSFKEIQFAKSTLMLILENDKPNKKWIDAIGGREANSSEMMFYFLKVWFIENGVTKDDLASAYINTPILKHSDISEFDINYKKDKPYIRVATLDTKEGQKLEFSFPVNNCLFSGDYNNDGHIDSLDVIIAKKNKKVKT